MSSSRLETLSLCVQNILASKIVSATEQLGELTIEVDPSELLGVMKILRDNSELGFEILIDLCGVDYLSYGADSITCLLYTSDAADDSLRVDLGGRRIIKKQL